MALPTRDLYWRRRIRRHVILALLCAGLNTAIYYVVPSEHILFKLSMASAYTGLTFLGVTLVLGPWNILTNRPNPVSTDVRRDIGIWAGFLGLFHTLIGLQVHMGGEFWLYFFFPSDQRHFLPLRYDPFGLANFAGLGATLVLILLLALSNNVSLRKLGRRNWKALQRWNYLGLALVAVHGLVYQLIEKRDLRFVALFAGIILLVGALQFSGYRRKKMQKSTEVVARSRLSTSRTNN